MRPIVWMKSSTGIPLSAWMFLKTCSARSGFSCGAGWAISATRVIVKTLFTTNSFCSGGHRPPPQVYRFCARRRRVRKLARGTQKRVPLANFLAPLRGALQLKQVLQRELHDSRVTSRENLSKVPAVQSENGIVRVQMVRHVERFGSELYGLPLRHPEFSG